MNSRINYTHSKFQENGRLIGIKPAGMNEYEKKACTRYAGCLCNYYHFIAILWAIVVFACMKQENSFHYRHSVIALELVHSHKYKFFVYDFRFLIVISHFKNAVIMPMVVILVELWSQLLKHNFWNQNLRMNRHGQSHTICIHQSNISNLSIE